MFTEGEKTEVQYLQAWVRHNREKVLVAIDDRHGRSPLDLVKLAVDARKTDRRAEKRGEGAAYSQIWCVFDVDEHAHLEQARALAEGNGIKLAVSNPCFELWLVLHDRNHQAWVSKKDVQSLSESIFKARKALTNEVADSLIANLDDAVERARELEEKHLADGSDPNENPSSSVWRLMIALAN